MPGWTSASPRLGDSSCKASPRIKRLWQSLRCCPTRHPASLLGQQRAEAFPEALTAVRLPRCRWRATWPQTHWCGPARHLLLLETVFEPNAASVWSSSSLPSRRRPVTLFPGASFTRRPAPSRSARPQTRSSSARAEVTKHDTSEKWLIPEGLLEFPQRPQENRAAELPDDERNLLACCGVIRQRGFGR